MDKQKEIMAAAQTAFVDYEYASSAALRPKFVSNNNQQGRKVASAIEEELGRCSSFEMSVAFITLGGLEPLLMRLKELEERGVQGRILTTDYLTFSDPKALRKLNNFPNIDIRMFNSATLNKGFHTKGYIFHYEDGTHKALVGSSNLTSLALTENKEWNILFSSLNRGELLREMTQEFEALWSTSEPLDHILDVYEEMYRQKQEILREQPVVSMDSARLEPNSMQVAFIDQFQQAIERGEKRGLLISATGTGKTYASAFAMRDMNPKRALFLVHREQVLRTARMSYEKVFGSTKSTGIFSGTSHEGDADIVFATVQTMSRDNYLHQFKPQDFDVVIIDEVHRAGANSYQKILGYFDAKYYFGMTATPDRVDGFDIYELFDHNILYEIRLQQALEESLLCPFHYFGITDLSIDGILPDDKTEARHFTYLTSDERVKHVMEQAEYYGHSGSRVKGLMFCSTKREAKALSEKFNGLGLRTIPLTGEDSQDAREEAVRRLTIDEVEPGFEQEHLDYILTVDIFNEGVDIPEINQVIMLRPTESPIVFVQQLGRGLRKVPNKEFVVVLDFIGNYQNNFMIPIALSGDRTYNKDAIRRYVMEGTRVLPGASSIHFDTIAREQIFRSIDNAKTGLRFLRSKYTEFKNKLGRIPTMCEFERFGEIDPRLFIKNQKSYYRFLTSFDKEAPRFSEREQQALEFISRFLTDGVRLQELLILKTLINKERVDYGILNEEMKTYGAYPLTERSFETSKALLAKEFYSSGAMDAYSDVSFVDFRDGSDVELHITHDLSSLLSRPTFKKAFEDVIEYGIIRYQSTYAEGESRLKRFAKYSRSQVCRVLDWDKDESSTVYGYKTKHNTCPIFVTYSKSEDISDSTKYEDRFINEQQFCWMTRSNRRIETPEIQRIIHAEEEGTELHLFVKKSDGEGADFYYMGEVSVQEYRQTTIPTESGELPIVSFTFRLDELVREDIYDYFVDQAK